MRGVNNMDQQKSVGMLFQKFFYTGRDWGMDFGDFCLQFDLAGNIVVPIVFLYRCGTSWSKVHSSNVYDMQVIDAITDVLVGFAIDKTKTRLGEKQTLVSCFGAVPFAVAAFFGFLVCRIFRRMESYSMLTQLTFFYHLCIRWSIFLWHRFCRL